MKGILESCTSSRGRWDPAASEAWELRFHYGQFLEAHDEGSRCVWCMNSK